MYAPPVPDAFTVLCDDREMSRGYDFRAEAEAALKKAAAATRDHDRLRWLRVAQVWQDLSRCGGKEVSNEPETHSLHDPVAASAER